MLQSLSARFSRRRIRQNSASPLRVSPSETYEAYTRALPANWLTERHGEVKSAATALGPAQARIDYSAVSYQALDPHCDANIFEVPQSWLTDTHFKFNPHLTVATSSLNA